MDRNNIKEIVERGIRNHERKCGYDQPDFANLVDCIVDEFKTEEEAAIEHIIELYPDAEQILRRLIPKR